MRSEHAQPCWHVDNALPGFSGTALSIKQINIYRCDIEKICKGGFNPQRGGEATGKLFGVASYFAANSSKSDDYTEERSNKLPKCSSRTLVVARVALGEAFRATQPLQSATRPPDDDEGVEFDSVWAEKRDAGGCVDHIEVMTYSEAQALPVALIDYKHKDICTCAFCRRRPSA